MRENSILFHFRFNSGNYRFSQSKDNLRTTQVKEKGGKFKQESFNYPELFLYCLYSSLLKKGVKFKRSEYKTHIPEHDQIIKEN